MPYNAMPCQWPAMPCHAMSCAMPCLAWPGLALPGLALPCHVPCQPPWMLLDVAVNLLGCCWLLMTVNLLVSCWMLLTVNLLVCYWMLVAVILLIVQPPWMLLNVVDDWCGCQPPYSPLTSCCLQWKTPGCQLDKHMRRCKVVQARTTTCPDNEVGKAVNCAHQ